MRWLENNSLYAPDGTYLMDLDGESANIEIVMELGTWRVKVDAEADMRKDATADQLAVYTEPTTVRDVRVGAFRLIGYGDSPVRPPVRRKVVDSLARSLEEHADVWAELAGR